MGGTYVVDDDMGTARPRDQPGAHGEADNTSRGLTEKPITLHEILTEKVRDPGRDLRPIRGAYGPGVCVNYGWQPVVPGA